MLVYNSTNSVVFYSSYGWSTNLQLGPPPHETWSAQGHFEVSNVHSVRFIYQVWTCPRPVQLCSKQNVQKSMSIPWSTQQSLVATCGLAQGNISQILRNMKLGNPPKCKENLAEQETYLLLLWGDDFPIASISSGSSHPPRLMTPEGRPPQKKTGTF